MSFFFEEENNNSIIDINSYKQFGCALCPLNTAQLQHPKINPNGSEMPDIYIIGEFPRDCDDVSGINFSGSSGSLLKNYLSEIFGNKFTIEKIRFNNIINCNTHNNKEPSEIEIECCKKRLIADIEKTKPKIIIGLGILPLKWFIEASAISLYRGRRILSKVNEHAFHYFPIFDPFEVLNSKKNSYVSSIELLFKLDLENVKKQLIHFNSISYGNNKLSIDSNYYDNVIVIDSSGQKDLLYTKLNQLEKSDCISIDIETTSLSPYRGKIISIAVANDDFSIVFPYELFDIKDRFKEFLLNSKIKISHNIRFELEWFNYYFGSEIVWETQWEDTMLLAYTLDERTSKNVSMLMLDTLTRIYLGFYIKRLSNVNRKKLKDEKIEKTLKYNVLDAKYTLQLYYKLKNELTDNTLKDVYYRLCNYAKAVMLMQTKGVLIDRKEVKNLSEDLSKQLEESIVRINNLSEVKSYNETNKIFNPGSAKQVGVVLRKYTNKIKIDDTLYTESEEEEEYGATDKKVLEIYANNNIQFAKEILKFREISKLKGTYIDPLYGEDSLVDSDGRLRTSFNLAYTGTGRLCLAEGTKISIVTKNGNYNKPIEKVRKGQYILCYDNDLKLVKRKIKWAGFTGHKYTVILYCKSNNTNKGNSIECISDHLIRLENGTYRKAIDFIGGELILGINKKTKRKELIEVCCVIETSQCVPVYDIETEEYNNFIANNICVHNSSEKPNLQNLPRKEHKEIRNVICCEKGKILVALDFGAVEVRGLAMASKDKTLIKFIKEGFDFHKEWTLKLAKKYPKFANNKTIEELKQNNKELKRLRDIVKNQVVFPYFYGAGNKSRSLALKIPENIMQEIQDELWEKFPGIKKWQINVKKFYDKNGYVIGLSGRRRHGILSYNAMINSPIQSGCADIMFEGLYRLSELAYRLKDDELQSTLSVHDELMFELAEETADKKIELIAKEMCRPTLDFIGDIPISVECKIGNKWGELEEIVKFDSTQFNYKE